MCPSGKDNDLTFGAVAGGAAPAPPVSIAASRGAKGIGVDDLRVAAIGFLLKLTEGRGQGQA
jgi:hypothetical protein